MAEQAARRRHQDDLAAPPLLASICRPAARAISQDWVTLTSITSRKVLRLLVDDLRHLVLPEATTRMSTRPNFFTAASTILSQFASLEFGRIVDGLGLGAERLAFGGDLLERVGAAGGEHHIGAGAREHLGGQRPERAGGAGDDRGLAAHVEQGERDFSGSLRTWPTHELARAIAYVDAPGFDPRPMRTPSPAAHASVDAARAALQDGVRRATRRSSLHRRDRDHDRADLVAAVDDLAALVRADDAGIVASSAPSPCRRR